MSENPVHEQLEHFDSSPLKERLMLCFRVLFDEQLNQGVKQGFATLSGIMNKFEKAKI